MATETISNPFVGPRSFEERDRSYFFGRERESRQLTSLIIAHRAVVLYAQSGAGKTSLLQASVIPGLKGRRRLTVLPIVRPGGPLPPGVEPEQVDNIYVFNVLLGLRGEAATPQQAIGQTLEEGIDQVLADLRGDGPAVPALLILDQFEELFTSHPVRHPERAGFFRSLQLTLQAHPALSLLISIREDFIARLDAFAPLMTDRLRTRFRMEPLSADGALAAIREPAARGGRPFEPGVAETLVNDLRRLQVSGQAPLEIAAAKTLGLFVEPVHLQIICQQLWAQLQPGVLSIRAEDLQEFGDVDRALIEFYQGALQDVFAQTQVRQRQLRTWFDEQLITPARTRGLVYRGELETEGLPNEAVEILNEAYIIRAQMRGQDLWYELAHDRMVEPILKANDTWYTAQQSPWHRQSTLWESRGEPADLLLRGPELDEAEAWLDAHQEELTEEERRFLDLSREARVLERESRRRQRLILFGVGVMVLLLAILSVTALVNWRLALRNADIALGEYERASWARLTAEAAEFQAVVQQETALAAAEEAVLQRATAEAASTQAIVQFERAEQEANARATGQAFAEELALSALSRQLAAQARSFLSSQPDLASLLAVEAFRVADTVEANSILLESLQLSLARTFEETDPAIPIITGQVTSIAMSVDGKHLAWGSADGSVVVWNYQDQLALRFPEHNGTVPGLDFSPDGGRLASGGYDYRIFLWDVAMEGPAQTEPNPLPNANLVLSLSFSPDGQSLAAALGPRIYIWDLTLPVARSTLLGSQNAFVYSVAWSPDGQRIASAGADNSVVIWNPENSVPILSFEEHEDRINSLAWSPDSRQLATGSRDGTVIVYDIETAAIVGDPFQPHDDAAVLAVAFSPDGGLLATGGEDRDVVLTDLATFEGVARLDEKFAGAVSAIAFSPVPGDQLVAVGSLDNSVRLYNLSLQQPLDTKLATDQDRIFGTANQHGGALMLAALDGDSIRIREIGGAGETELISIRVDVSAAALSSDGGLLAIGDTFGMVRIIETATGEQTIQFDSLLGRVGSLAFSPESDLLAIGSCSRAVTGRAGQEICEENVITIWNLQTGTSRVLEASASLWHTDFILSLAFSPDQTRLASGSADRSIVIWDLQSGLASGLPLQAHRNSITGLAFSPDGATLATGDAAGALIFWDLASSLPIGPPLVGPAGSLTAMTFDTTGGELYTGTNLGELSVWSTDFATWAERACEIAGRNLTQVEWAQFFPGRPYERTCPEFPAGL